MNEHGATARRIPYGYYLKARCIERSDIAHAAPCIREIWDWLLRNANHKDFKRGNKIIKRGQLLAQYNDIQEGLYWRKGWQKKAYSGNQIEHAMKILRSWSMITTQKTTRGLLITVLNYDFYQNPKNYERHTEDLNEDRFNTTSTPHDKQEWKNGKKTTTGEEFIPPTYAEVERHFQEKGAASEAKAFFDYYSSSDWHDSKGRKVRYWKQNASTWINSPYRKTGKVAEQPPLKEPGYSPETREFTLEELEALENG